MHSLSHKIWKMIAPLHVLFWLSSFNLLVITVSCHDSSNGETTTASTTENCPDETCATNDSQMPMTQQHKAEECGVWLALSTLPGTGIGMFAGKEFIKGENFMAAGDHVVPIIDMPVYNQGDNDYFLWDEYVWNSDFLYLEHLGVQAADGASAGFGAAANSFMDFVNADEQYPIYSIPHGLHRRSDPGAGAFTYYHSRVTKASSNVTPGEELFVSYGNHWFLYRKSLLGPIPVSGDYDLADAIYKKFRHIFKKLEEKISPGPDKQPGGFFVAGDENQNGDMPELENHTTEGESTEDVVPQPTRVSSHLADMEGELWDSLVLNSAWDDSPTMAALPPKEVLGTINTQTLKDLKKSQMFRDTDWLQEHGVCADTMYFGESTIRQAGHGAFASRRLRQGAIILPIPLIHIPDRNILNMYALTVVPDKPLKGDVSRPIRPQLLLNYCLGHRDSTLLLSPYGPVFNLVNHNQTLANVKLQWASPQRSQHNPDLLNMTITQLRDIKSSRLAMELVALRDIEPGEEIFLDYGDEWEAAWQKHVQEWKPVEEADTYVSAFEMNQQFDHEFRTEFEQMKNPYPPNLMLKFHKYFLDDEKRKTWLEQHPHPFREHLNEWMNNRSLQCTILRSSKVENRTLYTLVVPSEDHHEDGKWVLLEDVPREAIFFQDRPRTTDIFLENAFRHDIRIPDEIFPEQWKNLLSSASSTGAHRSRKHILVQTTSSKS